MAIRIITKALWGLDDSSSYQPPFSSSDFSVIARREIRRLLRQAPKADPKKWPLNMDGNGDLGPRSTEERWNLGLAKIRTEKKSEGISKIYLFITSSPVNNLWGGWIHDLWAAFGRSTTCGIVGFAIICFRSKNILPFTVFMFWIIHSPLELTSLFPLLFASSSLLPPGLSNNSLNCWFHCHC